MSDKKSKNPFKYFAKKPSPGVPPSIAAGSLGLQTEMDFAPGYHDLSATRPDLAAALDHNDLEPVLIVSHKSGDEGQGGFTPGALSPITPVPEYRPISEYFYLVVGANIKQLGLLLRVGSEDQWYGSR